MHDYEISNENDSVYEKVSLKLSYLFVYFSISFSFRLRVLKVSNALDEPGTVNWDVALCLLLAWIICYLCVFKGVKSTGKVRKLCDCFCYFYEFALHGLE